MSIELIDALGEMTEVLKSMVRTQEILQIELESIEKERSKLHDYRAKMTNVFFKLLDDLQDMGNSATKTLADSYTKKWESIWK
jgi:hypothetical protein